MSTNVTVIEPASTDDLQSVEALLRTVELPTDGLSQHLAEFLVGRLDGRVVGCVGLEFYGETAILRSLAVDPTSRGGALGTRLARSIIERARARGIRRIVLLTETAEGFFTQRLGFVPTQRDTVPQDVRESWQFTGAVCQSATCMHLPLE
jgi:amino-acid N-acetyltransferase